MEAKSKKEIRIIILSVVMFAPFLFLAFFLSPEEVKALTIFTPFGGRVILWLPNAPGCSALTSAVSVATLGTVNITIEKLKVKSPGGETLNLGLLRVNGLTIPGLTKIYQHKNYKIPGVWVLGNTLDPCGVCEAEDGVPPAVKNICKLPGLKEIMDVGCGVAGAGCPLNKLIYKIGTSKLPSLSP